MKNISLILVLIGSVSLAHATGNTVTPIPTNTVTNTNTNHNANHNSNTNTVSNQNQTSSNASVHSSNANQNAVNTTHYVNTAADAQGGSVGNVSSSSGPSNSSAQVGAVSSGSVSSSTGGTSSSAASADGAGANSNNVTMVENYTAYRIPVTTAIAASLTSGQDTCLGSASGGVQTQVLGISLGKTVRDTNCEMIKQVQLLQQMGMPSAACFRARAGKEGKAIDEAMRQAGIDCATMTQPMTPVEIDTTQFVTREELIERDNRMFRRNQK